MRSRNKFRQTLVAWNGGAVVGFLLFVGLDVIGVFPGKLRNAVFLGVFGAVLVGMVIHLTIVHLQSLREKGQDHPG